MATLRQLEYLTAVADAGSFTRAAELLHVSQPALSHQIQALERSMGGPLLERLPRSVRLTPTGRGSPARESCASQRSSVAPDAHRLSLTELAEVDWVQYAPGNGLADIVDAAWAAAGIRPPVAVRTEQASAAVTLSAAGLGPALVPANLVPEHLRDQLDEPAADGG